jgi:hypothetical protein
MARRVMPPPRSRRSPMRDLPDPGAVAAFDGMGATLWLDAPSLPGDWVPADGIPNSGTAGSSFDADLATVSPKAGTAVVDAADIALVAGGVEIEGNDEGHPSAASFVLPVDAGLQIDADDSGMWTVDFTVGDLDPEGTQKFFDWYTGVNIIKFDDAEAPALGGVIEWVDNGGGGPGSGGLICAFNDDTLGFGGRELGSPPRPAVGDRVRVSMRFDRTAGTYEMWLDGEQVGSGQSIDDMTWCSVFDFGGGPTNLRSIDADEPLGSLASTVTPSISNHMVLHHLMFHPDGTDGFTDPAALHAQLGA